MSVEREYGRLIFVCDDCGETFEASSREFAEAWAEVRDDEGWSFAHNKHWCRQPCEPSA